MTGQIWNQFLARLASGNGPFSQFANAREAHQRNVLRDKLAQQQFDLRTEELRKVKIPGAAVAQQNADTNATNAGTRQQELGLNQEKFNYKQTADRQKPIAKNLDSQAWGEYLSASNPLAMGPTDPNLISRLQNESARRAAQRAGGIANAQGAASLATHQNKRMFDIDNPAPTARSRDQALYEARDLQKQFASVLSKYNAALAGGVIDPTPYAEQLRGLAEHMRSIGVEPYYAPQQNVPQQSMAPPSLAKQYAAPPQQSQTQTSSATATSSVTDAHVTRFQQLVAAGMPEDQAIEQVAREMQAGK